MVLSSSFPASCKKYHQRDEQTLLMPLTVLDNAMRLLRKVGGLSSLDKNTQHNRSHKP